MFKILNIKSLVLMILIVPFVACVKKHDDRISSANDYYAIPDLNPSDLSVTTDEGVKVKVLKGGTYFVQDDYVGCSDSQQDVGTQTADDKIVVPLSSGKTAACTKPSSLAKMTAKPQVTFYKSPVPTTYYIQTREKIRTSGRTEAISLNVDKGVGIQLLDVVDYTTNSPILQAVRDRVELRALPGETYKVYHKITPKVLYIMKVSTKDKLSHLDLPIADNLGNGEFAVPVAAVGISTFEYLNQRNSDGEITNVYKFEPTDSLENTTHIRFNYESISSVDLPTNISKDLYPADYFTKGQWYASESVIDTRPGGEGLIGQITGAVDSRFRNASRVQFSRTGTGLIACNVGVDERYAEDVECKESNSVFVIPATGHAFELNKNSTTVREVNMQSVEAPFIKMNFDRVSSFWKSIDELSSLFRDTNDDQLIEVNFSKDKFNFITQRGANGRRVIYSFLRADNRPEYTPKRHYKGDRLKNFGYFVQEKQRIKASDVIHREEDLEKEYLVQRHNPNKPIVFYFSTITPDYAKTTDPFGLEIDYRDIGRKAVKYWNDAYARAGAPNRIILAEDDAQYGDIAYNTLNLIDSDNGTNLLGIGPSLVDPYTGEVINTNANVYIAPFRQIIAGEVRNYIKGKLGYYKYRGRNLPTGATTNSTVLGDVASYQSGLKDTVASLIPNRILNMVANFYHYGFALFDGSVPEERDEMYNSSEVIDLYSLKNFNAENTMVKTLVKVAERIPELVYLKDQGQITFDLRSRKDLMALQNAFETHRPTTYRAIFSSENVADFNQYNSMTRQIDEQCTKVQGLISAVQARTPEGEVPVISTEEELPALQECMTALIPDKFMATLVHEMGHNLGLRHNFNGSSDKDNFYTPEEVKEIFGLNLRPQDLPKSSSVMDYVRTEQDRLYFPGHYDIAAIRYGYSNKVEVKSSATRPNTPQGEYVLLEKEDGVIESLEEKLSSINKEAYPLKYCTDAEAILEIDPLCARHDFGTTPQMIVNDSINSFWESFAIYNFRYDRISASTTGPLRRAGRIEKLKRIYDEWRIRLANHLGKEDSTGNVYLQRYSEEDYSELIEELQAEDSDFDGKDYLAVRDQIFDFIMDVTFFPNQYCLANTPVGPKAYELTRLKSELKNQVPRGTLIASCENDYIKDLINGKGEGFEYVFEAGLPVDNMWYHVNPEDTFIGDRRLREPLDVVGSFLDRYFASAFLGSRSGSYYTAIIEKVFPNMMDEPDLFAKFERRMLDRLTKGADLEDVFERANGLDIQDGVLVLPNFAAESALLKAMWLSLEQGIRNPYVDNSARLSRYTRHFTDDFNQIRDAQENGGVAIPMTNGEALIIRPEAEAAFELVEALIGVGQTFSAAEQEVPEASELKKGLQGFVDQMAEILVVQAAPASEEGTTASRESGDDEEAPEVETTSEGDEVAEQTEETPSERPYRENFLAAIAQQDQDAEETAETADEAVPAEENASERPYRENFLAAVSSEAGAQKAGEAAEAKAAGITAEQYYLFSASVVLNLGEMGAAEQMLVQELYLSDLLMYLVFLKDADAVVQAAVASGEEPPAEAVQEIQQTLAQWNAVGLDAVAAQTQAMLAAQGVDIPVTIPSAESVKSQFAEQASELSQKIVEDLQTEVDSAKAYLEVNGDELEAQYEILRAILTYDFSEVGQDVSLRQIELGWSDQSIKRFYDILKSSSRQEARFLAEKYFSPQAVMKAKFNIKFPMDEIQGQKYR